MHRIKNIQLKPLNCKEFRNIHSTYSDKTMKQLYSIIRTILTPAICITCLMVSPNLSGSLQAQDVVLIENSSNPGEYLNLVPRAAPKYEGTYYNHEEFKKAVIVTKKGDRFKDMSVRFDLLNEILEVKSSAGMLKLVDISVIGQYTVTDDFNNKTTYSDGQKFGLEKKGLYRHIYVSDQFNLFEKSFIQVKEPDYVPALDAGSKNYKYVKKSEIVFNNGSDTKIIKRSASSIGNNLDVDSKEVKKFVKDNDLNLKNDNSLIETIKKFSVK